MELARARIAAGEDFTRVAEQVAASGAGQGGDLMTVHRGELAPEIERALAESLLAGVKRPPARRKGAASPSLLDGRIGGFNFQWAWASGHAAGQVA